MNTLTITFPLEEGALAATSEEAPSTSLLLVLSSTDSLGHRAIERLSEALARCDSTLARITVDRSDRVSLTLAPVATSVVDEPAGTLSLSSLITKLTNAIGRSGSICVFDSDGSNAGRFRARRLTYEVRVDRPVALRDTICADSGEVYVSIGHTKAYRDAESLAASGYAFYRVRSFSRGRFSCESLTPDEIIDLMGRTYMARLYLLR